MLDSIVPEPAGKGSLVFTEFDRWHILSPGNNRMSAPQQTPGPGPQKSAEVVAAVRGLCTVLNTATVYQITHPVFQRAVEQLVASLEAALKSSGEIPLFFSEGQVRLSTTPIEPGSPMFQKFAQSFETKGIRGITIQRGVTPDEITRFVTLVTARSDDLQSLGLAAVLERQGVRHIREQKVKIGIVGKDSVVRPEEKAAPVAAPKPAAPSASSRPGAWEIEAGTDELSLDEAFKEFTPLPEPKAAAGKPAIKHFVTNVLDSVQKQKTSLREASETIAQEFEQRLSEKVEEVRQIGEVKVRRLEKVKEVMLKELENLHLAAIVLDAEMNVVGANESGRKLIGNIGKIDSDSPIYDFVESKKERQSIEINGVSRLAHIILSTARDKREGTMLICLE